MSSRAVRRLNRDQDIIVVPNANDEDYSLNDTDVRSDSKHKNNKKQKAVNLFAQVTRLYIIALASHHVMYWFLFAYMY